MLLSAAIAELRQDLNDEDTQNYRWTDEDLERHINHALANYSHFVPVDTVIDIATTSGSRDIDAASLTDQVTIYGVEYPIGNFPPTYHRFQHFEDTISLLSLATPTGGDARIFYGRIASLTREQFTIGQNDELSIYDDNHAAQSFTPRSAHPLSSVWVKIYKALAPSSLEVGIQKIVGNDPSGIDLSSGTLLAAGVTTDTDGDWYEVDLAPTIDLAANEQMCICLTEAENGGSYHWLQNTYGGYPRGIAFHSTDAGANWIYHVSADLLFKEGDTYTPIPLQYEHVVLLGASAFALKEHAVSAINSITLGGPQTAALFHSQGNDRYSDFRAELLRISRKSKVRSSTMYVPATGTGSKSIVDWP